MSLKHWLIENEEAKKLKARLLEKQESEAKDNALKWYTVTVNDNLESQLKKSLAEKSPSFDLVFFSQTIGENKMKEVVLDKLKSYLDSEDIQYVVTSSTVDYHPPSCDDGERRDAYYALHVAGSLKL